MLSAIVRGCQQRACTSRRHQLCSELYSHEIEQKVRSSGILHLRKDCHLVRVKCFRVLFTLLVHWLLLRAFMIKSLGRKKQFPWYPALLEVPFSRFSRTSFSRIIDEYYVAEDRTKMHGTYIFIKVAYICRTGIEPKNKSRTCERDKFWLFL